MVPTFGSDTPTDLQIREITGTRFSIPATDATSEAEENTELATQKLMPKKEEESTTQTIIALRLPYSPPLTPYPPPAEVLSARSSYPDPDIFGRVWNI